MRRMASGEKGRGEEVHFSRHGERVTGTRETQEKKKVDRGVQGRGSQRRQSGKRAPNTKHNCWPVGERLLGDPALLI